MKSDSGNFDLNSGGLLGLVIIIVVVLLVIVLVRAVV
jgi:hypothetical protein